MKARRNAEDWRRMVFGSQGLAPHGCRLCLIYLADFMTTDRKVSRPRHLIARDLGVSERVVDKYVSQAHEAGMLATITAGHRGMTAVYQGTVPDRKREQGVRAIGGKSANATNALSRHESFALSMRKSANTVFAPIHSSTKSELTSCEPCGGNGCSVCCGGAA